MTKPLPYYIRFRGEISGPASITQIKILIGRGLITPMHELSADGVKWEQAANIREFFPALEIENSGADGSDGPRLPQSKESKNGGIWYAQIEGEQKGPVNSSQMLAWKLRSRLKKNTLVWKEGMSKWQPAKKVVPALFNDPDSFDAIQEDTHESSVSSYQLRPLASSEGTAGQGNVFWDRGLTSPPMGFSIASLVLGVASLVTCLGAILGVPAVIIGLISLSRIKRGLSGGRGMAVAGLTTGVISTILSMFFLLWIFLIAGWGAVLTFLKANF